MQATLISDSRDIYEVPYNVDLIQGETMSADFANTANTDISVYAGINDGKFIVTVGKGWRGTDRVTIIGSEGGEVDLMVEFGGDPPVPSDDD